MWYRKSALWPCLLIIFDQTAKTSAQPATPANPLASILPTDLSQLPPVPYGPAPTGCSQFEILVARGTSEFGPFGSIVGDPLVTQVTAIVPGSRGYAVQYPADASNTTMSIGIADTVQRLKTQTTACPDQKFALVGYSQGAFVMHNAVPNISDSIQQKILAFVMFGDPALIFPSPPLGPILQPRLWENCASGDPICGNGTSLQPHLTYDDPGTPYMNDSVTFIVDAFEGKSLPTQSPFPSEAPPGGSGPTKTSAVASPTMSTSATQRGSSLASKTAFGGISVWLLSCVWFCFCVVLF